MTEAAKKLEVKKETPVSPAVNSNWRPFEALKQEVDRLFDDFGGGAWPLRRSLLNYAPFARLSFSSNSPASDLVEKENEYEVTVELPGIDEKDIEVKIAGGGLSIKGEKKQERKEKKKDHFLSERTYGSFERYFGLPDDVDNEKISASFANGVLTVKLPKAPHAKKPEKTIHIEKA